MIVESPVHAAVWHCLNHYFYTDAVFLSERLFAEVQSDDNLYLLATAYYRSGNNRLAYHTLKTNGSSSAQCNYLLAICALELDKFSEAQNILQDADINFGESSSFVAALRARIATRHELNSKAIEQFRIALQLNPYQWSSFEQLCKLEDNPDVNSIFQLETVSDLSTCHGATLVQVMSKSVTHSDKTPVNNDDGTAMHIPTTPQQPAHALADSLDKPKPNYCTPEESPLARPLWMSGFAPLATRTRPMNAPTIRSRLRLSEATSSPTFGSTLTTSASSSFSDTPSNATSPSYLTYLATQAHKAQLSRRLRDSTPLVAPKSSLHKQHNSLPTTRANTPVGPLLLQPQQTADGTLGTTVGNVRRSSRLFNNNNTNCSSVKENAANVTELPPPTISKSPIRNALDRFATPKSPLRKFNKNHNHHRDHRPIGCTKPPPTNTIPATNRAKFKSLNDDVIIKDVSVEQDSKASDVRVGFHSFTFDQEQYMQLQKRSAEGLMVLLRHLGTAYAHLARFRCREAINLLEHSLVPNHYHTAFVYGLLGLAHFELTEYSEAIKYFEWMHETQPHRMQHMDTYSTALWHLQKEVALSQLAIDLVHMNKLSPITWCVNGNCFSLHKEHSTAIKFFQRAVQIDPNFPYAYTLLGHEYILTEDLDKAINCFRNAIRLDPNQYNPWFGLGTIYSKQERFHLAEIHFRRALAIHPNNSVILCHIGVVQNALKQPNKALETFNAALTQSPNSALCKFHRGSMYFNLGRYQEALIELEELKVMVPKESVVYYLIGQVHKKLGNTDLALMYFSYATDLDPKGASSQIREVYDPVYSAHSNGTTDGVISDDEATPVTAAIRNDSPHRRSRRSGAGAALGGDGNGEDEEEGDDEEEDDDEEEENETNADGTEYSDDSFY